MFVLISMYFSMVIPNIVTKFQNFDIFETCVNLFICRLLTSAAFLKMLRQEEGNKLLVRPFGLYNSEAASTV